MIKGFLIALTLIGVLCSLFGLYFIFEARAAKSWPTLKGHIVKTSIGFHDSSSSSGRRSNWNKKKSRTYFPIITYSWNVNDKDYIGSRYALGESHPDYRTKEEALNVAKNFRTGSEINVYYDPKNPESAVLDPAMKLGAFVPLPLGLFFAIFGLLGLKYWPKLLLANQVNQQKAQL